MEWLSQNWVLVVLAIGVVLHLRRGALGCCGHAGGGHHGGARHDGLHGGHDAAAATEPPAQATDPVSGRSLDPRGAITAVYRVAPVYFESRENRNRFEVSPEQFPIATGAPAAEPGRRRGHC